MPDVERIAKAIEEDATMRLDRSIEQFRQRLNDLCLSFAQEIGVPDHRTSDFRVGGLQTGSEARRLLLAASGNAEPAGSANVHDNTANWPTDLKSHRIALTEAALSASAANLGLTLKTEGGE